MTKKPRFFLYVGLILVILAIISFPLKARFIGETPGASETYGVGWHFAPVIGMFGLASIIIGLPLLPRSRAEIATLFLPVLAIMYIGLGFGTLMYSSLLISNWYNANLYICFFLIPAIIAHLIVILYLTRKESLCRALNKTWAQIIITCLLVLMPLLYTAYALSFLANSGFIAYFRF